MWPWNVTDGKITAASNNWETQQKARMLIYYNIIIFGPLLQRIPARQALLSFVFGRACRHALTATA